MNDSSQNTTCTPGERELLDTTLPDILKFVRNSLEIHAGADMHSLTALNKVDRALAALNNEKQDGRNKS